MISLLIKPPTHLSVVCIICLVYFDYLCVLYKVQLTFWAGSPEYEYICFSGIYLYVDMSKLFLQLFEHPVSSKAEIDHSSFNFWMWHHWSKLSIKLSDKKNLYVINYNFLFFINLFFLCMDEITRQIQCVFIWLIQKWIKHFTVIEWQHRSRGLILVDIKDHTYQDTTVKIV